MLRTLPRLDNRSSNVCAFCHYWEGDAQLHSHSSTMVEFNDRAKGRCLRKGCNGQSAIHSVCNEFQMSNEASRYCKR